MRWRPRRRQPGDEPFRTGETARSVGVIARRERGHLRFHETNAVPWARMRREQRRRARTTLRFKLLKERRHLNRIEARPGHDMRTLSIRFLLGAAGVLHDQRIHAQPKSDLPCLSQYRSLLS